MRIHPHSTLPHIANNTDIPGFRQLDRDARGRRAAGHNRDAHAPRFAQHLRADAPARQQNTVARVDAIKQRLPGDFVHGVMPSHIFGADQQKVFVTAVCTPRTAL